MINVERLTNAKVPISYQDTKQISENEGKHVIKHTRKFEFRTGIFVAAICSLTVENAVENFVLRGLHIPIIRCIFVVGLGDELLS
jgi:hypothetical protein